MQQLQRLELDDFIFRAREIPICIPVFDGFIKLLSS
jgi:hypothetical protein